MARDDTVDLLAELWPGPSPKPREQALTEVRAPYYQSVGVEATLDLLRTYAPYIDILKFGGGSFLLLDHNALERVIQTCHEYDILVSTGGYVEAVVARTSHLVADYFTACKRLGFDIVEVSRGFLALSDDDYLQLLADARGAGLEVKAEVGVQFGAGGASSVEELESYGVVDPAIAIRLAERSLDAGAFKVMVESEGITEQVRAWRTDVITAFAARIPLDRLVFEAADPEVFRWYLTTFGPDVNLFVDHSQVVELAALRWGVWGTSTTWGRIVRYPSRH
jgi:phosphosulfolactate synthase (CoM biosynthesis protein A)